MSSKSALIPVDTGRGFVIWHTREQYEALWRGVDREALNGMVADVDEFLDRESDEEE